MFFPSIYSMFRCFSPFSFCKHVLQLKEMVTSSRHFCFSKYSPQKVTGCKGKNKVTFSMISFRNNCFLSNTLLVLILEVVAQPVKTLQFELEGFRSNPTSHAAGLSKTTIWLVPVNFRSYIYIYIYIENWAIHQEMASFTQCLSQQYY